VLRTAIMALNEKARKPTGNKYLFICNEPLWYQVGQVLETYLAQYHTDGTFMWSMKANDYVSVGAKGFDTYNWQGNQVSFIVDRALTYEYPGKGYGIALDLTGDKTSAQPPIACFTLKGGDMMTSYLKGVGGLSGLESGEVSTPVAGAKRVMWGYSSIAVFNPYRSYVLREI